MRLICFATVLAGSLLMSETLATQDNTLPSDVYGLEAGRYSVGFQLFDDQDASRVVTGGDTSRPQSRPMRTYLWYPARQSAPSMRFGRYAALADEDIWPARIASHLREKLHFARWPLARSLSPEAFDALLQRPVRAVENASPLSGPFPLIVIGQGLYYESPVAFSAMSEYLAGHGMVVATAPLVGTNSPLVKLDPQDLETQVRDLEFAIARARQCSFVSPDKLGVLGFDMGGMAGLILAMRNRDVDAFVSLDSGILFQHSSGLPRSSPDYRPSALRIPWLHVGTYEEAPLDEKSLFEAATHSERYRLAVSGLGHVDLTSYALVEGRSAAYGYWEAATPAAAEGHRAISRYVLDFFEAYLARDGGSGTFPSWQPEDPALRSSMKLEHRAAAPASISYDEFVQAVVAGRIVEAIGRLRSLASAEPDNLLLKEMYLERLAFSLAATWGLTQEAIQVIEFEAELYPASARVQTNLAESFVLLGNLTAAIEVYKRYLAQHPDDVRMQSRVEELLKRQ